MTTKRSRLLFTRAQQILPGGVDSPVRAFKSVGASPLFIRRASGARIEDVDGNRYIDFVMSENSMGFHADGECLRVLGNAINLCRKGQLALRTAPGGKAPAAQAASSK